MYILIIPLHLVDNEFVPYFDNECTVMNNVHTHLRLDLVVVAMSILEVRVLI